MSIRSEWNRAKNDYYGPESRATDAALQLTPTPDASNLEPWQYATMDDDLALDCRELTGFGGIAWGRQMAVESVTLMNPRVPGSLDVAQEAACEAGRAIPKYIGLAMARTTALYFLLGFVSVVAVGLTGSSAVAWVLGGVTAVVVVGVPAVYVTWRCRVRWVLRRGRKEDAFVTVSGVAVEPPHLRGSVTWLVFAQRIAKLCAQDDQVAELCGSALRDVLWTGRRDLNEPEVVDALMCLRDEAEKFATARRDLEQTLLAGAGTSSDDKATRLAALTAEAAERAVTIREETRIAGEVRDDMISKFGAVHASRS